MSVSIWPKLTTSETLLAKYSLKSWPLVCRQIMRMRQQESKIRFVFIVVSVCRFHTIRLHYPIPYCHYPGSVHP